ncbi:hypothetical protein SAY86_029287 [Trapa natans]|uniref:AAA+ ATPase domain-containing protein n=1 Tax=Trapa natans TaxID=22666 RepID=A0AAN7M0Z3_TRANT|nr:hypothetical protein SAY86_029287 [Trapa natans]
MASFSVSPTSNKGKEGDDELSRREQSPPLRRDESSSVNLRRKKRKKFSEGDGDDHQEEGKDLSTSEDAIYEQKVEPEVDLSKSMLRERYKIASQERKVSREKNIEGETVTASKNNKKMDTINGGGDTKVEGKVKSLGSTPDDSTVTVHKESGPMFRDLGGMREVLEELKMEVIVPLYHPELPRTLGVKPMAGLLLHGPPGCGKTKLARAIANETGVPFYQISATEAVFGVSGASEEYIRALFMKAHKTAPSIVFIDEIDAIASKNLQREMERRIVSQLMTCMDESHKPLTSSGNQDTKSSYVLVIGATNRPDAVDPALRRPGRFDREIALGVPDESARAEILSVLTRGLKLEGSFDVLKIARTTPRFVGADLEALANKAGNLAMKRIIEQRKLILSVDQDKNDDWWSQPWLPEEREKLSITIGDFEVRALMYMRVNILCFSLFHVIHTKYFA